MPDLAIDSSKNMTVDQNVGFKLLSIAIKVFIALLSIGFIYYEIFHNRDLAEIQIFALEMLDGPLDLVLLGTVLIMMPVNWTLESAKWKFLIGKIEHISLSRALRAVFSGTSVSVFTPNRIGDFGARVLYLDNSDRIAAVFITIVGSISQLVITILLGFLGMSLYTISHYPAMIEPVLAYLLFGVLALATFLTFISYFNVSIITNWGKKLFKLFGLSRNQPIFGRLKGYVEVFSLYTSRELSISLGYSLLRYCVFSLQFYLLLTLFDVNIPMLHALRLISITFFVMAVIPTIALTEIGVRGSVALFFLGLASENSIGIVTATFTLWIINLALPALIGSILVFGTNIFNAKR